MTYYSDLAHQLRRRGCEEDTVAEVLQTVDDAVVSSGASPEEEFGSPKDYAAQYEGPQKSTPGLKALSVFGVIGIFTMVILAIWPDLLGFNFPFYELIVLFIILVPEIVLGAYLDLRLPTGFTSSRTTVRS